MRAVFRMVGARMRAKEETVKIELRGDYLGDREQTFVLDSCTPRMHPGDGVDEVACLISEAIVELRRWLGTRLGGVDVRQL